MRLMIVDEHPGTREMIWTFLALPGVTLCECASGNEALDRVREFKPDWVTMGIAMPGLDGFQTTKALLLAHPSARVVIVSNLDEPHLRQSAHDAGAMYFILKEGILALRMILVREMIAGIPPATDHD
jgi:DNA-binding NarL/FixJ family response regulator